MATPNTPAPVVRTAHPHAKLPAPVNVAGVANLIAQLPPNVQYPSGAALCVAAHPALALATNKSICTAVRGVMRGTNHGVGRGNRYTGITPKGWLANYKAIQAQQAQRRAAAQAPVQAPAKAGK